MSWHLCYVCGVCMNCNGSFSEILLIYGQGHRELLTQEASDETFTQTLIPRGDSEAQPSQVCMSLRCWRKPEYLETTDKDMGKLGIKPGTVLLQGYDATHFRLRGSKHKLLKLKLPPLQLHLKQLFNYSSGVESTLVGARLKLRVSQFLLYIV